MLHAIQYSLITYLENEIESLTEVKWMFDGVSLSKSVKPFATVEQMPDNTEVLSKERFYETIYRFQVGLFANSVSERSALQEKIRSSLLKPNIPLFKTEGPTPESAGFFYCDVIAATPMPVEELADETNKHRVYFDVEVPVTFRNGNAQFEQ